MNTLPYDKDFTGQIGQYREGPIHAIVQIVHQEKRGYLVEGTLKVLAHAHRATIPELDIGCEFQVSWNVESGWAQIFFMRLLKAYNVDDAIDIINDRRNYTWTTEHGIRR